MASLAVCCVPPNGMRLSCGADPAGATSSETTMKPAGAQTQFLPRPGAVSFKRLLGSASEHDDVRNISERTNGTVTYKLPKASLREVFGPKASFCLEILASLLRHGVSQP